jgi:hypothetical protein
MQIKREKVMFLVEITKGIFINAEEIDYIDVSEAGIVRLSLRSDSDNVFKVDLEFQSVFINNLQAINGYGNIEYKYHEVNNAST